MENFYTIKQDITNILTEKKSKFITDIFFIESKEKILEKIAEIKRKYYDAKHHCYAYRIIENDKLIEQSSDDKEPSGTAGAPMLQILQKNNFCNILVIVTRYFGGILLGTGGLVRAYSQSLQEALDKSQKIEMKKGIEIEIEIEYNIFDKFQYFCKKNSISIVETQYQHKIICKIITEYSEIQKMLNIFETKGIKVKNNYISKIKYFRKVY